MKRYSQLFKKTIRNSDTLKPILNYYRHVRRPRIFQSDYLHCNAGAKKDLIICVDSTFSQHNTNATTLIRLGFAEGWSKSIGNVKIIFAGDLIKELDRWQSPAVMISQADFKYIPYADIRKLRGKDLFVWANIHPRASKKFENINLLSDHAELDLFHDSYSKVILAEPRFLWHCFGAAANKWFADWVADGFRWETIFPAADVSIYYPEFDQNFSNIDIAYVGGYWPEKAQAFDSYLRPFESILVPFGYDYWPYQNYQGKISISQERRLYSSAKLIPLIHGPAGWSMAEVTERYLKAPACRAFCIADQNPVVREIYTKDEMLQAESAEEFIHLVHEFIANKIDCDHWRDVGYEAILAKHTYVHRAQQIFAALGA